MPATTVQQFDSALHNIQAYVERYLDKYTAGSPNPIYTSAAMDFGNFTKDIKEKTAIYYDARNYEVPDTYKIVDYYLKSNTTKSGYIDFSNFNLFDIIEIENNLKEDVLDDVFLNIGLNVTEFLGQAPHNIF